MSRTLHLVKKGFFMDTLLDRFLRYVQIDTQSDPDSSERPSTAKQMELARLLHDELCSMGLSDVCLTETGCVLASVPASDGLENAPVLAFLAHMDTAPDASGKNVKPAVVQYSGGLLPLGNGDVVLDPAAFPDLQKMNGKTLVVTDGTTLLGADDKAGIAEIMTAIASLKTDPVPHGMLKIAFTPDEEVGRGVSDFDVASFGADVGYTVDGGAVNLVEYQNFNAAKAKIRFHGRVIHTGYAKDIMRNAVLIASEFNGMLPAREIPAETEAFEGFFHLQRLNGDVASAESVYLIRDHDAGNFEVRKKLLQMLTDTLNQKYGAGTVELSIHDQYRNMEDVIRKHFYLVENALSAIAETGREPQTKPVRGGTDGAILSHMGLPCPNLGDGSYNIHGVYEFACVEEMEDAVRMIRSVIRKTAVL